MYAIIEFEKKECAVVPLSWLTESQALCYWPRNTSQQGLDNMVKQNMAPKKTWSQYKVLKLLNMLDTYEESCIYLEKYISNVNSTSDSGNMVVQEMVKKTADDSDFDSDDEPNVPSKKPSCLTRNIVSENLSRTFESISNDDSSEEDDNLNDVSTNNVANAVIINKSMNSTIPSASGSQMDVYSNGPQYSASMLDNILKEIKYIREVQDQQMIKLDMIERNQQTSVIQQLQRPTSMPNLPISNKQDYKAVEEFLVDENNALYMRRRLAAIGGSSVRNTVMNILKFMITNKVAQHFNWSGRDKKPFKNTRMLAVINEAVKLSYSGRERSDLTDTDINNAVKDWLKLAKHRYLYSKDKKENN